MSEFDPNLPIYQQIMHAIKTRIVNGSLKAGDKLPSVREQAEAESVNPNTVQRAYQELEREGVTETRRGMGTYIVGREGMITALRAEMASALTAAFIQGLRGLGYSDGDMEAELGKTLKGEKRT